MALLQTLKSLVNQRLSAAAEEIFGVVGRILTEYEDEALQIKQETDRQRRLLDMVLQPIKLQRADSIYLIVCKEEVFTEQQERNSSLVQEAPEFPQIKEEKEEITSSLIKEEPASPQIKEEHDERLQRSEEDGGSTETLLSVKHEDDDENIQAEPVASTSSQHMETQADVEDCGTSQPTSDDQLLSSHCSESDITEDSDEWDETMDDQSSLNTLKSQHMGGNSLSLSNKLLHDLKSPKQSHSMRSQIVKKCFSCADCGKMFSRKVHLKKHTMINSGEKPFVCTVCDKGFSHNGNLTVHMLTHTGEKPFMCTVCGKGCSHNGNLKVHMRTHTGETPFTCTVCGKGCIHNGALKVHMRIHTGEKPFTCTVCGKGCSQTSDLKSHMRTHTGEKPCMCTVCGKGFKRKGNLKVHMRTHAG